MYCALLTNRYLTSRVIPFVAVAAVALCVALVIIVVSVMSGFLNMVRESGRTLMGDVVISYPVNGIPYYDRLIERLGERAEVAAATPVVDSWGLLRMPYPQGDNKETETVQIWGIDAPSFAEVTGYAETIHWRSLSDEQWQRLFVDVVDRHANEVAPALSPTQRRQLFESAAGDMLPGEYERLANETERAQWVADHRTGEDAIRWMQSLAYEPDTLQSILTEDQWRDLLGHDPRLFDREQILRDALTLGGDDDAQTPGIVLGMHVSAANQRTGQGTYEQIGGWWMPAHEVTLTTIPISSEGGMLEPASRIFRAVNEFRTGVFLIDDKRVMIPLPVAQDMFHLDEAQLLEDPTDPTSVIGTDPARATMVLVRGVDGITPMQLREIVASEYDAFREALMNDDQALRAPPSQRLGLSILTWEQQQSKFIGPIEKERELMRTLFSLVYLVCAGLVLAIFWAIVHEKTRDIGILRSIGASRLGVSWIFLRYGLVVGIFGAILGLGLGWLVVHNINAIHEALGNPPRWLAYVIGVLAVVALVLTIVRGMSGRLLPIVLGSLVTIVLLGAAAGCFALDMVGGVKIWDPAVYYFSTIPNDVDLYNAVSTMIGAVIFSLLGAFLPAAKAADTDPVVALRYE